MRIRLIAALTACAALVAGCGGDPPVKLPVDPEAVIRQVHGACVDGDYEAVVGLFANGPGIWQTSPGIAKGVIDRACHNLSGKLAQYLVVDDVEVRGDGAKVKSKVFVEPDHSDAGRPQRWELVRKEPGWLIVSGP